MSCRQLPKLARLMGSCFQSCCQVDPHHPVEPSCCHVCFAFPCLPIRDASSRYFGALWCLLKSKRCFGLGGCNLALQICCRALALWERARRCHFGSTRYGFKGELQSTRAWAIPTDVGLISDACQNGLPIWSPLSQHVASKLYAPILEVLNPREEKRLGVYKRGCLLASFLLMSGMRSGYWTCRSGVWDLGPQSTQKALVFTLLRAASSFCQSSQAPETAKCIVDDMGPRSKRLCKKF